MQENKNLIFAFTPKGYLITLTLAIVIRIFGENYIIFSNCIINLVLILLGLKLTIIIHECGHLTVAKIVGGIPKRLVLGKGHEILRKEIKGIKLIINAKINSGLAFSTFPNLRLIRWKLLAYTCGGVLFNFGFAYLVYLLFGFERYTLAGTKGINGATAFIIANALAGASNLLPFYVNFNGIKLFSDGLNILAIPFRSRKKLLQLSLASDLVEAMDYYESRQYAPAIEAYENCLRQNPELKLLNINLSLAYLKAGQFTKSLSLLKELEEVIDQKENKPYQMFLFNGLAWNYLLTNTLDLADQYSERALLLATREASVKGTRASVLIELGKLEEGKNLIINTVDFNFPNSQTLTAAMYLAYAFYQQENAKESGKYFDFVAKNLGKLDLDEKVLYERIRERIALPDKNYQPAGIP